VTLASSSGSLSQVRAGTSGHARGDLVEGGLPLPSGQGGVEQDLPPPSAPPSPPHEADAPSAVTAADPAEPAVPSSVPSAVPSAVPHAVKPAATLAVASANTPTVTCALPSAVAGAEPTAAAAAEASEPAAAAPPGAGVAGERAARDGGLKGKWVRVHGLKSNSHLNGKVGKALVRHPTLLHHSTAPSPIPLPSHRYGLKWNSYLNGEVDTPHLSIPFPAPSIVTVSSRTRTSTAKSARHWCGTPLSPPTPCLSSHPSSPSEVEFTSQW
jgi:hypothetical protein